MLMELFGLSRSNAPLFIESCDVIASAWLSDQFSRSKVDNAIEVLTDLFNCGSLRDGMLSKILMAHAKHGVLSFGEVLANSVLIMAAGQDTTANLIGSATASLLRHRDRNALESQCEIYSVVENVLEMNSPIQAVGRIAACDISLGSALIREGDAVLLFLGAANTEISRSQDAYQRRRHIAFGAGRHRCLGAGVARAIANAALKVIASEVWSGNLQCLSMFWHESPAIRGLARMHVSLG
ncbi:hypothetical protein ACWDFL_01695 [Streptomyces bungoensis]